MLTWSVSSHITFGKWATKPPLHYPWASSYYNNSRSQIAKKKYNKNKGTTFKIILLIADCYQITKIVEKSQHLCHFRRQSHALARHEDRRQLSSEASDWFKSRVTDIACPYLTWGMHMFFNIYIYNLYAWKKRKVQNREVNLIRICSSGDKLLEFSVKECSTVSPLCGYTTGVTGGSCAQATLCKTFSTLSMSGPKVIYRNINFHQLLPINRINPKHVGCPLLQEEKETFSLHLVTSLVRVKPTASFHGVVVAFRRSRSRSRISFLRVLVSKQL